MAVAGKPGRLADPHLTNPDVTVAEGIIADLTDGVPKAHACRLAGVGDQMLQQWMDQGTAQVQRILAFDSEHPGALDCAHDWTTGKNPECKTCGTYRPKWAELVESNDRHGHLVVFLRDVHRAQAQVVASVIRSLLEAGRPGERYIVTDDNGEPFKDKMGRPVTSRRDRGDWRADAWYLERIDPLQFNLTRRSEEADVEGEPEALPQQVLDEVADMAERLGVLDT